MVQLLLMEISVGIGALEATTENRWKALGFALVAIARLEIAGTGPMDFVSR
jgi:hypothetical protein